MMNSRTGKLGAACVFVAEPLEGSVGGPAAPGEWVASFALDVFPW